MERPKIGIDICSARPLKVETFDDLEKKHFRQKNGGLTKKNGQYLQLLAAREADRLVRIKSRAKRKGFGNKP